MKTLPHTEMQATTCQKSLQMPETINSAEWEVVEKPPLAGTLNEMVEMMVRQVETPNGAPLFLFMPLVNAVLAKQRRLNELREQQTRIAVQKGGVA